jgi:hypothetical protein
MMEFSKFEDLDAQTGSTNFKKLQPLVIGDSRDWKWLVGIYKSEDTPIVPL